MKKIYNIQGMTCNGCRTSVEKALNEIPGVSGATVSLEKEEAVVEMNKDISIVELQNGIPDKFHIEDSLSHKESDQPLDVEQNVFGGDNNAFAKAEESSKIKQLKPLFLILGYITVAAILLNFRDNDWSSGMLDFMGLFYIVFSFFKMLDLKGFAQSFQMYDPLAKRLPIYGKVYPFIETALGLLFLMRFYVDVALILTLLILGVTTIGVTKTLVSKKEIQCACLGTALKLPMTQATFIENAIMIVMAIGMLAV